MYHVLLQDVKFWLFLLSIDKGLAANAAGAAAPAVAVCTAPTTFGIHAADRIIFPRSPATG